MRKNQTPIKVSRLFRSLSQPARIEILLAIGSGEACVCHLEAMLQMRQAYISQHLMALREAGILDARREGRFVFYRLKSPEILDFIRLAAVTVGIPADKVVFATGERAHAGCCCPQCAPVSEPVFVELHLSDTSS
jgi:ArsR family transcriptional regulator